MGWWKVETYDDAVWGDEVADVMDDALDKIQELFLRGSGPGRPPTMNELRAGLEFSAAGAYHERVTP